MKYYERNIIYYFGELGRKNRICVKASCCPLRDLCSFIQDVDYSRDQYL